MRTKEIRCVDWAEGTPAPAGWHLGAHVSYVGGSGYWLVRDADGAALLAQVRPDLYEVDDLDLDALVDATGHERYVLAYEDEEST